MRWRERHPFAMKAIPSISGVFVISLFLLVFVYRSSPGNVMAMFFARTFRFPALRVGGETITLDEYYRYERALRQWYGFDDSSELAAESAGDRLTERLIIIALERELGRRYGITVNQKETDAAYVRIEAADPNFETTLRERYGWTERDFKELIVRPLVFERKLRDSITDFDRVLDEAREKTHVKKYLE